MGYGDYDGINKPYISKKGKNWYFNNKGSVYGAENAHFDFPRDKAAMLKEIEENGIIRAGLQPYAPIPIEHRYSPETKLYFALEDEKILIESLTSIMSIPFILQDRVAYNNINPIVTGYDYYNNPIYGNIVMDVTNAILTTDSLTRAYLHNTIMAFCFEYRLPANIAYDLTIYNALVNDILSTPGFKDRITLIRTDISNNRILFLVSNITESHESIDRYKECYDANTKYHGIDILFTKRADTMYNTLSNRMDNTYIEYRESVNIFIGKRKDM